MGNSVAYGISHVFRAAAILTVRPANGVTIIVVLHCCILHVQCSLPIHLFYLYQSAHLKSDRTSVYEPVARCRVSCRVGGHTRVLKVCTDEQAAMTL